MANAQENKISNLIKIDQFLILLNNTQIWTQTDELLTLHHRYLQPKTHETLQTNRVNISRYKWSTGEQSVLSKVLSYCPYKMLDSVDLCYDLKIFLPNIKLRE